MEWCMGHPDRPALAREAWEWREERDRGLRDRRYHTQWDAGPRDRNTEWAIHNQILNFVMMLSPIIIILWYT